MTLCTYLDLCVYLFFEKCQPCAFIWACAVIRDNRVFNKIRFYVIPKVWDILKLLLVNIVVENWLTWCQWHKKVLILEVGSPCHSQTVANYGIS